jgi:transcriptional regulator with XRE-family HTH domain
LALKSVEQKVGETLAKIRCNLSLTQREVAEASNLTKLKVSRIERGMRVTRIRDVITYAEAVGYEIRLVPRKKC